MSGLFPLSSKDGRDGRIPTALEGIFPRSSFLRSNYPWKSASTRSFRLYWDRNLLWVRTRAASNVPRLFSFICTPRDEKLVLAGVDFAANFLSSLALCLEQSCSLQHEKICAAFFTTSQFFNPSGIKEKR